jgi:hypothetical protein
MFSRTGQVRSLVLWSSKGHDVAKAVLVKDDLRLAATQF